MNVYISKWKKYQIETWHMNAIEHNTCDYQMNIGWHCNYRALVIK
jgi:hypothetical protein